MGYRKQTIGTNNAWRVGSRGNENCWPGNLAKDNAAVNGSGTVTTYGKVAAGTCLAEDSSGDLHPCGLADLASPVAAAVALEVEPLEAQTFYVGDQVAVVSKRTTRTIALTGEADDEVFTAASPHGLRVGDIVDISAVTGGTGFVAGTYYVKTVPSLTTFTLSATDGGSTAAYTTDISAATLTYTLAEPIYVNITGTRNIATVDKDTGDITLSGSTFTAAAGDQLVKIGAYLPAGFLNDTVSTRRYVDDTEVTEDKPVNLAIEGDVRSDYALGVGASLIQILKGGSYSSPLDGAAITPKFVGFTFRDV